MKKSLIVVAYLLVLSPLYAQIDLNYLVVDLKQEVNDSFALDFSSMQTNLKTLIWMPKLKSEIEKYKGIPTNDSIASCGYFDNGNQANFDFYKSKKYEKNDFLKYISDNNVDTLRLSPTPIIQGFLGVVGFYKNMQFIILDTNRNQNFTDDVKYEFDISFRNNPYDHIKILDKLPKSKYYYQIYSHGKINTYERTVVFYPDKTTPITLDKKRIEYSAKFRYKDYWKGTHKIDNTNLEFYYQSRDNLYGALFVKSENISFSKTDDVYNNQFAYNTYKDTIAVANRLYKVDSINSTITKLYLRQVGVTNKKFGNVSGAYLKGFIGKDLDMQSFDLSKIIKEKKYTLLEFWGTWCSPCIEMTPKLIKFEKENKANVNIVSIANDENREKVIKYVEKNKIDWIQGFVDMNSKIRNPILTDLNITQFPTFILISSGGKILYRGGAESFDSILTLIQ